MAPRISRQSESFGLSEQTAHQEHLAALPSEAEVADMLKGPRIQAGLLRAAE